MKNYLIGSVRPVIKNWCPGVGRDIAADNDTVNQDLQNYVTMYNVSRASAKKFLQGEFTEVVFTAPVLDARLFQIAQWYMIKELWFREPCNILCMGADTLFKAPTEIFGHYKEMRLFNYTDPRHHPEMLCYGADMHYFNDDIRYFPAEMDRSVWEKGERLMAQWFDHRESHWAWGQLIHNHMFWSQGLDIKQVYQPELAWQVFLLEKEKAEDFNCCSYEQAKILHFHSSRGSGNRAQAMVTIARDLGIIQ